MENPKNYFLKQKLFTTQGLIAKNKLIKLGIEEKVAEEILQPIDHEFSQYQEILRQYRFCFGASHNWLDSFSERLRITKEFLKEAEENYDLVKYHNL